MILKRGTIIVKEGVLQSDSFEEIRCNVASALQNQVRVEANNADIYCWIQNLYTDRVVYSYDGKYFLRSYVIDKSNNVTFGDAGEVEASWEPSPVTESFRLLAVEATQQVKSAFDESTGEATITVIQPGFNKAKSRYYPAAMLKRDYKIFEGAKMFLNHATEAESESRPEGKVEDWVASIKKVWAETDGRVRARIAVISESFKAKLLELKKHDLLGDMGVSIRAVGEASKATIDDVETNYVESLMSARSVDFVTFAGAGGLVEALESAVVMEADVDLMSEADLRKRRPDLVTLIESKSEDKLKTTLEQQLQEAQTELAKKNTELVEANTKLTQATESGKKFTAAAELTKLLSESTLPEMAKKRIQKQFEGALTTEKMKEAIELEVEYLKSLGATVRVAKNNGEQDNGEVKESEEDVKKRGVALVESFQKMGMSKEAAQVAANLQ